MCDWTDCPGCEYFIERECHARPHPKLECDLQQEVEGGRQLTLHARTTDTVTIPLTTPHVGNGASRTSFTFESSCERFTTIANDG